MLLHFFFHLQVQYIPNKEEYVSKEQKTDFQREDALYL